jgi:hypothetical protein
MEFWLSGSLSHEPFSFFHDVIPAIREPFTRTFFFFHNGILTIRKPFTRAFSFYFTMEFWLSGSLSRIFLSHGRISAITEPFTNFSFTWWNFGYHGAFHEFLFHMVEFLEKMHDMGDDSFHTYHKEYLHRIRLIKNMPLDLEPPLQGKEYGPLCSNATTKKKANVFSSEITYRHVIRLLWFSRM